MDTITAVCFVVKGNETRLTVQQKYVFFCVLALFGKDIAENFVCMLTFCDNSDPPALTSLTSKESPFSDVKKQIKDPWYLKFNNSALY